MDATTIDVTLEGPRLKASGQRQERAEAGDEAGQKPARHANDVKMPSMLKQDQPVIVVGDALDYDGAASKGDLHGAARLFQGDTTIKGDTIVIDNKAGDLTASGGVTTTSMLEGTEQGRQSADGGEGDEDKKSSASVDRDREGHEYDDADRRLTYTGDAHMSGPDGDMTAREDRALPEAVRRRARARRGVRER